MGFLVVPLDFSGMLICNIGVALLLYSYFSFTIVEIFATEVTDVYLYTFTRICADIFEH